MHENMATNLLRRVMQHPDYYEDWANAFAVDLASELLAENSIGEINALAKTVLDDEELIYWPLDGSFADSVVRGPVIPRIRYFSQPLDSDSAELDARLGGRLVTVAYVLAVVLQVQRVSSFAMNGGRPEVVE